MGPNNTINAGPIDIPTSVFNDALMGNIHLYFYGWCEYDDIFDGAPRHRSEFCLKVVPIKRLADTADGFHRSAFAFIFHPTHNGADFDCLKPIQTGSLKNPLPKKS